MSKLPENYSEKVYAGWLGKCIGVRFGAPIENWSYRQIRDYLGEVKDYLPIPEGKIFQPDDDTSLPMIFLKAVEDYGPGLKAAEIAKSMLNYLGDQHGSLWWGGYGVSTEHTAYLNLKAGIPTPLSGSIKMNGATAAEQIGGQIFSDIWGLLAPDDPHRAAEYAREAACVTHDRNGIYGGMFVAAMVSAAFSSANPLEIIHKSLAVIPEDSDYVRTVKDILGFYEKEPQDWRACCEFIQENYGGGKYPGIVHILPNIALMIMGLCYGKGDFSRSIQLTNMGGWDTDCNVGNIGTVMGVAAGLEGIADSWRHPQNDMFVAANIIGSANILDIPSVSRRIERMGKLINGQENPCLPAVRYDFEFPGATHGFKFRGEQRNILTLQQTRLDGKGVLKGVTRLLKKKQDMVLYVDTYIHPEQLNSYYYGAGFSPKIYPGQTMRARLSLPADGPESILVSLCVRDDKTQEDLLGPGVRLIPGEWQELEWQIPHMQDVCLSQAGLSFRNMDSDTWKGLFYVDYLDWKGNPSFTQDFSRLKMEFGAAEQWTYLRGFWRLEEDGYHGSGIELNESYSGDPDWDDVNVKLTLKPLIGELHGLNFRVKGALHSYSAALKPGKLCLSKKKDGVFTELASEPFNWETGRSYQLEVQAKGNEFILKINETHLKYTDEESPYLKGQIGLFNGANCHTCFEKVEFGQV